MYPNCNDYYVKPEDLEQIEFQESCPPILTARGVQYLFGIGKNKLYELLGSGEARGPSASTETGA